MLITAHEADRIIPVSVGMRKYSCLCEGFLYFVLAGVQSKDSVSLWRIKVL
jgi:hypothetical protein